MKKLVSFLLSAILAFSLCGCLGRVRTLENLGWETLLSEAAAIEYKAADGGTRKAVAGLYHFDEVKAAIADILEGLTLKPKAFGTLDAYETLTVTTADSGFEIYYKGSSVSYNGKVYSANNDLSGIAAVYDSCFTDTETEYYNVTYGQEANQNMDVFLPSADINNVPFMLLIHGGGWAAGSKEDFYSTCKALTDTGYAAVTINYRLTGQGAQISDMLDDISLALDCVKSHAGEWGIDAGKTALMGGSAGAHLSLLYGYKTTAPPVQIKFIVSMSGPADFTNPDYSEIEFIDGLIEAAAGEGRGEDGSAPLSWSAASPVNYVTPSSPYTIFANGVNDDIVPYSEAGRLEAALTAADVAFTFVPFPNSGHALESDPDAQDIFYGAIFAALTTYLPLPAQYNTPGGVT